MKTLDRGIGALIDEIWDDAAANFDINYPENLARYTLIILTQSRWTANLRHLAYAQRLIGTLDKPWRIESGIVAMYENVVAAHYLKSGLVAFVTEQGRGCL